ncbi:MAG: hypothetical protein FJ038_06560 [Chloroflexi bacterium]|nr:hypothetical protein [Chloroflexota bacterium]
MPGRKRKVVYPTNSKPKGPPRPDFVYTSSNAVSIDLKAAEGRAGLAVGDRVRITGTGLYSGEAAVIERFSFGAIPSAVVRTEGGRSRQVRTVDLEPIGPDKA